MSGLKIDHSLCTRCLLCIEVCPFNALSEQDNQIEVNDQCRLCNLCVLKCPVKAMAIAKDGVTVDKSKYVGVMVVADIEDDKIHSVTIELLSKAQALAKKINHPVLMAVVGFKCDSIIEELSKYAIDELLVIDDESLQYYRADLYEQALGEIIELSKPSVVLFGATPQGRSIAPCLASRFRTGLTADCTTLDIKKNTDLIQIRPAFGGNIMAQIITANHRPQFATVRYKVMDMATQDKDYPTKITRVTWTISKPSAIQILKTEALESEVSISEAEVLIVAGMGMANAHSINLIHKLAEKIKAQVAYTRPMIEKGFANYRYQIGLSGRTVKPKLIIVCGVSGAVQFVAGMKGSERIIAINPDKDAPIFNIAHVSIVGDANLIITELLNDGGVEEYATV